MTDKTESPSGGPSREFAIEWCDALLDTLEAHEARGTTGEVLEIAQRLYAEAERDCPICGPFSPLRRSS